MSKPVHSIVPDSSVLAREVMPEVDFWAILVPEKLSLLIWWDLFQQSASHVVDLSGCDARLSGN